MKIVGFITEYNPFHLGHKYHLKTAKELSNATHSIAVMSGSFVQRGEPSLVDKWTKTKMAIECYRNILSVIKKSIIDNADIDVVLRCIDKFDSLLEDESNGIEEKLKYHIM